LFSGTDINSACGIALNLKVPSPLGRWHPSVLAVFVVVVVAAAAKVRPCNRACRQAVV